MKRLKALYKGICPGDFRMALSFLCKFRGKNHVHEPTIQKPFYQFRCKFDFVHLEVVFFAHEKAKGSDPRKMSRRFPKG
jgi:hypothetical protein